MLKKRIITTLLYDGSFSCVKPISFGRPYRTLGNLKQYINVCERRNIDELILLDITATEENRPPQFEKLNGLCDNLFCPVSIGGGISSLDDIGRLLDSGADKVVIRARIDLIKDAAHKYGSQAIVLALDYPFMYYNLLEDIESAENLGVGEIVLTNQTLDGTMKGYDLVVISECVAVSNVPIIANGGCGQPSDMLSAFKAGADAVAAGSMFLYTDWTPRACAEYLDEQGVSTRI